MVVDSLRSEFLPEGSFYLKEFRSAGRMNSMDQTTLKVLLTEDEDADARFIQVLLSKTSKVRCELTRGESVAQSVEILAGGGIQVVLLDLNLTDSTGLETLTTIQSAAPDAAVVVLTGLGDDEVGLEAVRLGAQDYLVKGEVDTNLLERTLLYAYERTRSEQQLRESESRLRMLTEQIPAILWTTNREHEFTSSRGQALANLGLKPGELNGQTLMAAFNTDDASDAPIDIHARALRGENSTSVIKWKNHWFQAHVEPLRDSFDEIVGAIGVALDVTDQHQLEESIEAAQRIQQHLLPKKSPVIPGFDIAGACYPAERCSGDYYDFIRFRNDELVVVLADAAGHGFGPAILATTVRSYLRSTAMQGKDVHEMLTTTNWMLSGDAAPDQFVTLFCARFYPQNKSMVYAAAGHQAFILDAHGAANILDSNSMPLGIMEEEVFPLSRPIKLKGGDILLFLTDGILEAESADGKQFGRRRTIATVHEHRHEPATAIVKELYNAVQEFISPQPQKDDVTAVVVKVLAGDDDDTG